MSFDRRKVVAAETGLLTTTFKVGASEGETWQKGEDKGQCKKEKSKVERGTTGTEEQQELRKVPEIFKVRNELKRILSREAARRSTGQVGYWSRSWQPEEGHRSSKETGTYQTN
jgi:hypothetical protein